MSDECDVCGLVKTSWRDSVDSEHVVIPPDARNKCTGPSVEHFRLGYEREHTAGVAMEVSRDDWRDSAKELMQEVTCLRAGSVELGELDHIFAWEVKDASLSRVEKLSRIVEHRDDAEEQRNTVRAELAAALAGKAQAEKTLRSLRSVGRFPGEPVNTSAVVGVAYPSHYEQMAALRDDQETLNKYFIEVAHALGLEGDLFKVDQLIDKARELATLRQELTYEIHFRKETEIYRDGAYAELAQIRTALGHWMTWAQHLSPNANMCGEDMRDAILLRLEITEWSHAELQALERAAKEGRPSVCAMCNGTRRQHDTCTDCGADTAGDKPGDENGYTSDCECVAVERACLIGQVVTRTLREALELAVRCIRALLSAGHFRVVPNEEALSEASLVCDGLDRTVASTLSHAGEVPNPERTVRVLREAIYALEEAVTTALCCVREGSQEQGILVAARDKARAALASSRAETVGGPEHPVQTLLEALRTAWGWCPGCEGNGTTPPCPRDPLGDSCPECIFIRVALASVEAK